MSTQTILAAPSTSRQFLRTTNMDDQAADKEERKREYNRLAQREFRRRRKEHLKRLEQAQVEKNSEQSDEIERLRYQNEELRRENDALRAQLYGPSSSRFLPTSFTPSEGRSYSLSPSISAASISGAGSPTAPLVADTLPIGSLDLTSSMLPPTTYTYAEPAAVPNQLSSLQSQAYMVHPSGLHHNTQSSPESSEFRGAHLALGSSFQPLDLGRPVDPEPSRSVGPGQTSPPSSLPLVQFDKTKARSDLIKIFQPYFKDQSVISSSSRHLAALRSLKDSLPDVLKPSRAQLDTPHYYEIDMIPSPSLRDRLMGISEDVARSFISEAHEADHITIWGDDALNEVAWEMSQSLLDRWGWLVGREWTLRANYWRQQRGAPLLAEW